MREIDISAGKLVEALLNLESPARLCLLDSCGVSYGNSHLLVAGFEPVEICRVGGPQADTSLAEFGEEFGEKFDGRNRAAIFTLSYDLGAKFENLEARHAETREPDIYIAFFDTLVVHDYSQGKTFLLNKKGDENALSKIEEILRAAVAKGAKETPDLPHDISIVRSNFSKQDYLDAVGRAKTYIRRGDTYQINLTQQLRAELPPTLTLEQIFLNLRTHHPAPFSAFIRRDEDTVISASPERFLRIENVNGRRIIRTSPIKGTRPRGRTPEEDERLKKELLASEKDRAENVMIVDLLRNDIGRVCKFGTVEVEELCALEEHPTFFNLVSTVRGELSDGINFSDVLRAVFPCGSITGAPKIRTMQLIDELETAPRGLSMGAIGYVDFDGTVDMSVAIRTMTVRGSEAVFNVGGGIVSGSVPELEYEETLVKAKALLSAINGKLSN